MRDTLQALAMAAVDVVMTIIPRRVPDQAALSNCRIISHRGEHDNHRVMENTLQAFADARTAGVWGIECDIRWTADLVPVICHDADAGRVFGAPLKIAELSFAELRSRLPQIPSLQELVTEFGGNTHLMLELKERSGSRADQQAQILEQQLAALNPGEHYHVLALDAELFSVARFLSPRYRLPVAGTNVKHLSRLSLERGYAGLAGHYLLLGERLRRRHVAAGQYICTGFPRSRNVLFRELNRGVAWIFSNDAVHLQGIRDHYLR